MNEAYFEIVNKVRENQKHYVKTKGKEFKSLCKEFIEFNNIEGFRFKAYIPYFNDGDVCEFYVSDMKALLTKQDNKYLTTIEGVEYTEIWEYHYDGYYKELTDSLSELKSVLHELFLDYLQIEFSSHIEVTVLKNKIIVEEYTDHD